MLVRMEGGVKKKTGLLTHSTQRSILGEILMWEIKLKLLEVNMSVCLLDLSVGKNCLSPRGLTIKERLINSSTSKLRIAIPQKDTIMKVKRQGSE